MNYLTTYPCNVCGRPISLHLRNSDLTIAAIRVLAADAYATYNVAVATDVVAVSAVCARASANAALYDTANVDAAAADVVITASKDDYR